jgi:hypothetical protein
MEKRSFTDYLKIIKEEKNQKEEQEIENKVVEIIKEQKPKKEKKKEFKCPPETSDLSLNLEKRQKAIDDFGYGPLNPLEENKTFWENKVDKWRLDSVEEAKKSLCANCSAFVITKNMLDCISKGLSDESDSWDTIEAGQLGFCETLDFKCSALRTCDAWIVGGPISDKKKEK